MCLSDELERQRDFYEEQGLEMPSSLQSKSENINSHDNVTSTCSGRPKAKKKLIICFSGTARVTFNLRIKHFYCISSIHIENSSINRELSV